MSDEQDGDRELEVGRVSFARAKSERAFKELRRQVRAKGASSRTEQKRWRPCEAKHSWQRGV